MFVSELRERVVHFSPSQMIGDVFVRWGPAFDMLLFFSSRFDSSLRLLKSLQSSMWHFDFYIVLKDAIRSGCESNHFRDRGATGTGSAKLSFDAG